MICYLCRQLGHMRADCPLLPQFNELQQRSSESFPSPMIVDSGATHHMGKTSTNFRQETYQAQGGTVLTATSEAERVGLGEIEVVDSKKNKLLAKEALHVPKLQDDLLSVSKLCDQGLTGKVDANKFTFQDDLGQTVLQAERKNDLCVVQPPKVTMTARPDATKAYTTRAEVEEEGEKMTSNSPDTDDSEEHTYEIEEVAPHDHGFSHGKFAHLAAGSIKKACGLAGVHPPAAVTKCRACSQTKMTKKMPKQTTNKPSRVLELIYVDVAGKFGSPALDKSVYSLVIVDAYSNMCWVFGLRTRNGAPQVLRDWRAEAEQRCGQRLGAVRTDNAPELVQLSTQWQKTDGVVKQLTVPYSSWQNGKVERFHCSLEEGSRALLESSRLPTCFWLLAMEATCELLNMKSCDMETGKSRCQVFCGTNPTIEHLHPWGCEAYTYISAESLPARTRKDSHMDTGRKAIFVGHCKDTTKMWRFWAPDLQKVIPATIVDWYDEMPGGAAGIDLNIPTGIPIIYNNRPNRRPVGRPRKVMGAGGAGHTTKTTGTQMPTQADDRSMIDPDDEVETTPETVRPQEADVMDVSFATQPRDEDLEMEMPTCDEPVDLPAEIDPDTGIQLIPMRRPQDATPEDLTTNDEEGIEGVVMSTETALRMQEQARNYEGKRHMQEESTRAKQITKKARVMLAGTDQPGSLEYVPIPKTYREVMDDPD
ncbi:hypothetical protein BROUX41_001835 [Berkeleyomyces rouxiae]